MTTETKEKPSPYRKDWMSDDQWACYQFLADVFGGFHHVYGPVREFGYGICTSVASGKLATFDFDGLTRIVLLAHDRMIRVEIQSSGPRMVKLCLHQRHQRDGCISRRHPTIEQALETHRRFHPAPGPASP